MQYACSLRLRESGNRNGCACEVHELRTLNFSNVQWVVTFSASFVLISSRLVKLSGLFRDTRHCYVVAFRLLIREMLRFAFQRVSFAA